MSLFQPNPSATLIHFRTSSEFNRLCIPYLYRDLDLDHLYRHNYFDLQNIMSIIIKKHASYVRSIRIHIGNRQQHYLVDEWQPIINAMALIVRECVHTTSIAVYYAKGLAMFDALATEIVRMIGHAKVVQLGIYSVTIMKSEKSSAMWDVASVKGPAGLLRTLFASPSACRSLQRLDIVIEHLSEEFIDLLRTQLPNLRSLTIRRTIRHRLPSLWKGGNWTINENLTRLQLMGCNSAHAGDMPALVRHFRGLQEFIWATCGHNHDAESPPPKRGWSRLPGALPSVRPPLRLLHLEHIVEWEIHAMSVIPTETLIVTNHDEHLLAQALCRGAEMFLGLKALRVLPPYDQGLILTTLRDLTADRQVFQIPTLDSFCKEKSIDLRRDAKILFPCSCCIFSRSEANPEVT